VDAVVVHKGCINVFGILLQIVRRSFASLLAALNDEPVKDGVDDRQLFLQVEVGHDPVIFGEHVQQNFQFLCISKMRVSEQLKGPENHIKIKTKPDFSSFIYEYFIANSACKYLL